MKKILLSILLISLTLTACGTKDGNSPEESETPFEEVQKVDIEISDYVDPDASPEAAPEATPTPTFTQPPAKTDSTQAQNNDSKASDTTQNNASSNQMQTNNNSQNSSSGQQNTQSATTAQTSVNLSGKTICIDPGHGIFTENKKEKIAPNSSITKDAYKTGTKGTNHIEDDAVLAIGLKLKAKLEELGATVIMTRSDAYINMTNIERAQFANNNNADIAIKLHADGTQEGGSGMTMLVPGYKYITDNQLLSDSKRLGKAILKNAVSLTGAVNRGTYTNTEMTGFNWSTVPVVLFEMGFMTNPKDEAKLFDEDYQQLIAEGIVKGIQEYYK